MIRSIPLFASETWKADGPKVVIFEKKVLRNVFGPIIELASGNNGQRYFEFGEMLGTNRFGCRANVLAEHV